MLDAWEGVESRSWKNDYWCITTAQGKALESLECNRESREAKDKMDSRDNHEKELKYEV